MKLQIWSPPYHRASGGIRVLHLLGYLAHKLGHDVDMRTDVLNPEWGEYSRTLEERDLFIVPEIYPATRPEDGNVVRWVLFFPGRLSGPREYPAHEHVWAFMDEYLDETEMAAGHQCGTFFLPSCDMPGLDECVRRDLAGVCWQGKGPRVPWPPGLEDFEIRRDWPTTRDGLIHLLQRAQRLYSCDPHTALNSEALLCGCEVRLWDGCDWRIWTDPKASRFVPKHDEQLALVEKFLAACAQHFGLEAR